MTQIQNKHIMIDGSAGEGGGQVLRSALSLSILTGRPFAMTEIRGKRRKPGLMRQHLTAVRAATVISSAKVVGDSIKSMELEFTPQAVRGGRYEFAVGSGGSAMLILQTILLPLCFADSPSEVVIEGGTHNPMAPPFDFIQRVYLPILERMGAQVNLRLEQMGFYPAGGGKIVATIEPIKALKSLVLDERGALLGRNARAIANHLPASIAERELVVVRDRLDLSEEDTSAAHFDPAPGMGNVLLLDLKYEALTEVFTGFGENGISAEKVAGKVCTAVERYLKSTAPVGDYLADQLLLPFALAGGGRFTCTALTKHFKTNVQTIERFLKIKIQAEREERLAWNITFKK